MQVISIQDVQSNLRSLLASVEAGEEFVISSGQKLIAKLGPCAAPPARPRPKVGEMISPPCEVPDEALLPLTETELRAWGL